MHRGSFTHTPRLVQTEKVNTFSCFSSFSPAVFQWVILGGQVLVPPGLGPDPTGAAAAGADLGPDPAAVPHIGAVSHKPVWDHLVRQFLPSAQTSVRPNTSFHLGPCKSSLVREENHWFHSRPDTNLVAKFITGSHSSVGQRVRPITVRSAVQARVGPLV